MCVVGVSFVLGNHKQHRSWLRIDAMVLRSVDDLVLEDIYRSDEILGRLMDSESMIVGWLKIGEALLLEISLEYC